MTAAAQSLSAGLRLLLVRACTPGYYATTTIHELAHAFVYVLVSCRLFGGLGVGWMAFGIGTQQLERDDKNRPLRWWTWGDRPDCGVFAHQRTLRPWRDSLVLVAGLVAHVLLIPLTIGSSVIIDLAFAGLPQPSQAIVSVSLWLLMTYLGIINISVLVNELATREEGRDLTRIRTHWREARERRQRRRADHGPLLRFGLRRTQGGNVIIYLGIYELVRRRKADPKFGRWFYVQRWTRLVSYLRPSARRRDRERVQKTIARSMAQACAADERLRTANQLTVMATATTEGECVQFRATCDNGREDKMKIEYSYHPSEHSAVGA